MLNVTRGLLVEYTATLPPLILPFEFNPKSIDRIRSTNIKTDCAPGTQGGYDFTLPTDIPRVAQGVRVEPEIINITILLDATDRMNSGDPVATRLGVSPELDTLRTMVEPRARGPAGAQLLANLGLGARRAFQSDESASVFLFVWDPHVLPVFLTSVQVQEIAHLPSLAPYRAEATLVMRLIESDNPFYRTERLRQRLSAALNTTQAVGSAVGGLF